MQTLNTETEARYTYCVRAYNIQQFHIFYAIKFRHFHSFRSNQFWTFTHNYFGYDPIRGDVGGFHEYNYFFVLKITKKKKLILN